VLRTTCTPIRHILKKKKKIPVEAIKNPMTASRSAVQRLASSRRSVRQRSMATSSAEAQHFASIG
jgi:hypothetical protein